MRTVLIRMSWGLAWSPRSQHRWRRTAVLGGVVLGLSALLVALSLFVAATKAEGRMDARRPYVEAAAANDPNSATLVARGMVFRGEQIPIVWLRPGPDTPVPPGLTRFPDPGTAVISEGLRDAGFTRATSGFVIGDAGNGVHGTIGAEGLAVRSEWLVYAVPPAGRSLGTGGIAFDVQGFGGGPGWALPTETTKPLASPAREAITAGLLVALPGLLVIAFAGNAMSALRNRRAEALLRLGLARRSVRQLMALESLMLATPAAVLAVLAHQVWSRNVTQVPGAGVVYAPNDLVPPVWATAGVGGGALLLVCWSGVWMLRRRRPPSSGGRLLGRASSLSLVGLLPAAVAAMVLGRTLRTPMLVFGGLVVAVVSFTPWLPLLFRQLARHGGRVSSRPSVWIMCARLARTPKGLARPAAVVGVLVLLTFAWTGVQSKLLTSSVEPVVSTAPASMTWRDARSGDIGGVRAAFPDVPMVAVVGDALVYRDCAELVSVFGELSCTSEPLGAEARAVIADSVGAVQPVVAADAIAVEDGGIAGVVFSTRNVDTAAIERYANGSLPAPNFSDPQSTLGVPRAIWWLVPEGALGIALLTFGAAIVYGNRIISMSGLDWSLARAGLSTADIREVRRVETLLPNLIAATAGALVGLTFCWAGTGFELSDIAGPILLAEFALVVAICLVLAWGLSRLRAHTDGDST